MTSTAPKRSPFQRERDLELIADWYLRGKSQRAITDELNSKFYSDSPLTRQAIGYDIRVLVTRWRLSSARAISDRKAEELAKVDKLEREYWDAWERSRQNRETLTEETQGTSVPSGKVTALAGMKVKKVKTVVSQVGDPSYLDGVQWCINKRCQILGLDAPALVDHTIRKGAKRAEELTDDELAAIAGTTQPGGSSAGTDEEAESEE